MDASPGKQNSPPRKGVREEACCALPVGLKKIGSSPAVAKPIDLTRRRINTDGTYCGCEPGEMF